MKAQNKAIQKTEQSDTSTEEFHFAGGGEYKSVTISAKNIHEATEKYEEIKDKLKINN